MFTLILGNLQFDFFLKVLNYIIFDFFRGEIKMITKDFSYLEFEQSDKAKELDKL